MSIIKIKEKQQAKNGVTHTSRENNNTVDIKDFNKLLPFFSREDVEVMKSFRLNKSSLQKLLTERRADLKRMMPQLSLKKRNLVKKGHPLTAKIIEEFLDQEIKAKEINNLCEDDFPDQESSLCKLNKSIVLKIFKTIRLAKLEIDQQKNSVIKTESNDRSLEYQVLLTMEEKIKLGKFSSLCTVDDCNQQAEEYYIINYPFHGKCLRHRIK